MQPAAFTYCFGKGAIYEKIIAFLLGLTLTATCFTSYMPAYAADISTDTASLEELQTLENESNQKYNTLLLAWAYDPEYVDDVYADFPSFYGGAYLNDTKELVIQVTSLDAEVIAYFENLIDLTNVIFEKVDYPYSQLVEEHDAIVEALASTSDDALTDSISAVGIAMQDNAVALYVDLPNAGLNATSLDDEIERELSGFENIKIIEGIGRAQTAAAVKPGSSISNRSVGFWAKDSSGNIGIVTAPHSTIAKGDTIKINGTTFGTASTPYFSGKVDAVFIKRTNTSFSVSRAVAGANFSLVDDSYTILSVGSSTYSSGVTCGYQTGTVLDTNYTITYSDKNVTLTSCVLTDAPCYFGDSGGVVAGGGGTTSGRYVAGIITGKTDIDYQVYVKMVNIKSTLGVTVY